MSAICRVDCRNTLGEGCVWDPRDSCLYWTDIEEKKIFRLRPSGEVTEFSLPERAGFVLPRRKEGFIIGFASGIARVDGNFLRFERLVEIEPDLPQTRVNDAAVDPYGGLVFGTFDERDRQPVASVYRLTLDGSLRRLLSNVTVSNGLAFSPDGRILYFADTPVGTVRRFSVGADFESFDEMPPLVGPDVAPGAPDGAVVDAEGAYWNARVWGGCLVRIAPDGSLMERVDLPVKGPTCVALGGETRTRLFATTLRLRHSEQELEQTPFAGGLFETEVRVPGTEQSLCAI